MRRPLKIKRRISPDVRYENERLTKFINTMMWDGKKETARKVVYDAFELLKKDGHDPLEVFETALKNAAPSVEVRSRRVGGANYQVPREVRPERRQTLAMRWLRDAIRNKSGGPAAKFMADELLQASKNEGSAVKKREDTHKMAEANRAFAHFAW